MKGPTIAVMLGGKHSEGRDSDYKEDGDLSLSETRARAEDAASAFAASLEMSGRDPARIVKAFCALKVLCDHLEELEESGETDDEERSEEEEDRPEESAEEE